MRPKAKGKARWLHCDASRTPRKGRDDYRSRQPAMGDVPRSTCKQPGNGNNSGIRAGSFESSKTYGRSLLSGDRPCRPKRALKTRRADRSGLLEVVGDQLGHFEHRHLTLAAENLLQFFV